MSDKISLNFDKNQFTFEDAKTAALELFNGSAKSVQELQNRPWYKSLFKALTFNRGDKRLVLRNVRDIATLQSIFVQVYTTEIQNQDEELDQIVNSIIQTQVVVKKLYNQVALGVRQQEKIQALSESDKWLLVMLLRAYKRALSTKEDAEQLMQEYNRAVFKSLAVQLPETELNPVHLESVQSPGVFYRCIYELKMLAGVQDLETIPDEILEMVNYLPVSENRKKTIRTAVSKEINDFGLQFLIEKYKDGISAFDLNACDIVDMSESLGHEHYADEFKIQTESIPIDVIKKVYQFCKSSLWPDTAETNDFFAVRKGVTERNLHVIEKKLGMEDIIYLENTPVEGAWNSCIGFGDSIFVQVSTSRAVYRIDLTTKMIQRIYENKMAGKLISANAESITLIDTTGSEWTLRRISQEGEEIVQLPQCEWNHGHDSLAIWKNKLYVLARTGFPADCFQTADLVGLVELGVYFIDLKKPEKFIPVKENIIGYDRNIHFHGNTIQRGPKGWLILCESEAQNNLELMSNNRTYALQYFSFEDESLVTVACDCGYEHKYKRNIFSKESSLEMPNRFFVLGDTVCYESGEKRYNAMVTLSNPQAVKFM